MRYFLILLFASCSFAQTWGITPNPGDPYKIGSGAGGGVTFGPVTTLNAVSGTVALTASHTGMDSWKLNATGNITVFTITGQTDGSFQEISLCQDATGSRTSVNPTGYVIPFSPNPATCTISLFKWNAGSSTADLISSMVDSGPGYPTETAAPAGNPLTGHSFVWSDPTAHNLQVKAPAGTITGTVQFGASNLATLDTVTGDARWASLNPASGINSYTAGITNIFPPSATNPGVRLVPGTRPSGGANLLTGSFNVSSANVFEQYDGAAWNSYPTFQGSSPASTHIPTLTGTAYQFGDSKVAITPPTTLATIAFSADNQTITLPAHIINAQTATYQVLAADFAACKTIPVASGTFTITLVASGTQPASGQCIDIINYGTGVVTVARSGQNINGAAANLTIAAGSASAPLGMHVVSDGTNYVAQTWGAGGGLSGLTTNGIAYATSATAITTEAQTTSHMFGFSAANQQACIGAYGASANCAVNTGYESGTARGVVLLGNNAAGTATGAGVTYLAGVAGTYILNNGGGGNGFFEDNGNIIMQTTSASLQMTKALQLKPLAAATILAITCNAGAEGQEYAVTDANSTTFNAALAGGGSNHMVARCNASAWVIH